MSNNKLSSEQSNSIGRRNKSNNNIGDDDGDTTSTTTTIDAKQTKSPVVLKIENIICCGCVGLSVRWLMEFLSSSLSHTSSDWMWPGRIMNAFPEDIVNDCARFDRVHIMQCDIKRKSSNCRIGNKVAIESRPKRISDASIRFCSV